jgi:hypothetical protein
LRYVGLKAPRARDYHPREEHLLPLMVIAGTGLSDVGRRVYHDKIGGKLASGFASGKDRNHSPDGMKRDPETSVPPCSAAGLSPDNVSIIQAMSSW